MRTVPATYAEDQVVSTGVSERTLGERGCALIGETTQSEGGTRLKCLKYQRTKVGKANALLEGT